MRSRATIVLAVVLGFSSVANASPHTALPAPIVSAATGCWTLHSGYTITFVRAGAGLRAHHSINGRTADSDVDYQPSTNLFGTARFDSHHGGSLVFRLAAHGGLEVSFYSRYFRSATAWQPVRRCHAHP